MEYSISKYAEILSILQLIGADFERFSVELASAYFVEDTKRKLILEKMDDLIFRSTTSLGRLDFLEKSIENGARCFGYNDFEKMLLKSKRVAIQTLTKAYGETWFNVMNIDNGSALCKYLIGISYFYGIGQEVDQSKGESYLMQSMRLSKDGGEHAIFWLLSINQQTVLSEFDKLTLGENTLPLIKFIENKYNYVVTKLPTNTVRKTTIGFH